MSTEALPPTLAANPRLGDWLRIDPDGIVEVRAGKVELVDRKELKRQLEDSS